MMSDVELRKRLGEEHFRMRLEREHNILEKKTLLGYWSIRLKHQYVFFRGLGKFLSFFGLWQWGRHNTLQYMLNQNTIELSHLPSKFEGYRIMHLSDLHIESMADEGESLLQMVSQIKADLCVITGDFRYMNFGAIGPTIEYLRKLRKHIQCSDGCLGVLGNHDALEMLPHLEQAGIRILMNEHVSITRGGDSIKLIGVDDPHYFKLDDLHKAFKGVDPGALKILLAHSPEIIPLAGDYDADVYLCGHAHGGQICLPGEVPLIANLRLSRKFFKGAWTHGQMRGYTSRGTGASGLPVRYFSRPEIVIHELKVKRGAA